MTTTNPSPEQGGADNRYRIGTLFTPANLLRLVMIGAVLLVLVGAFAVTAGWLSPNRLTPEKIVARFESLGAQPGFRRNHAKGVCVTGYFEGSGDGTAYSKAAVFEKIRVPVFGRFALAGPNPFIADTPKSVRSLALNFTLPDGEIWRTGMNDIPVFPVNSARAFYEQLEAGRPDPATGKPDPEKMAAFTKAHPESGPAIKLIKSKPFSSGFANAAYSSLNAFLFVDENGHKTPVRWSVVPHDAFAKDEPSAAQAKDQNYLFDAVAKRIHEGPAQWDLVATIGEPGDPTADPTLPWPDDRKKVALGTLTVNAIADEADGPCTDINFDPLILPAGIEGSDDPILSARSAAYARSFQRREGENKQPSAVRFKEGS